MKIRLGLMLAAVALVAGLLGSCSATSDPKAVSESFLEALKSADFDKAMSYTTDDSKSLLSMLKMATSSLTPEQKVELDKQKAKAVKITNVTTTGDTAKVKYTIGEQPEQTLDLVKKDEKWLIVFKKSM